MTIGIKYDTMVLRVILFFPTIIYSEREISPHKDYLKVAAATKLKEGIYEPFSKTAYGRAQAIC